MNANKGIDFRTLKKGELYYSDLLSYLPINYPDLNEMELEVKGRTYKQNIYYKDQLMRISKLRVITVNPKKRIDSVQFTLGRRNSVLEHQISFSENLISFELRIISIGSFFIRFYTEPVDEVNLNPPDYYKPSQISKNGDNL